MRGECVVGLLVTIGYTFGVWAAVQEYASPALIDFTVWSAGALLILATTLYGLSDRSLLALAGGSTERSVRYVSLGLQLAFLLGAGWWWTAAMRVAAEGIALHRLLVAMYRSKLGFRAGRNKQGVPYIHCYGCGNTSYHPKDIEEAYCGYCHKFHGHHQQRAAAT